MHLDFCPNCFATGSMQGGRCMTCGYTMPELENASVLKPGIILKKQYQIGRVLGNGGFGITYIARTLPGKNESVLCAIKEYFPQDWANRVNYDTYVMPRGWTVEELYRHGLDNFMNEARILQSLKDDTAIVDVWDFFEENGTAYLVMEWIPGETLSAHMRNRKKTFSLSQASAIIRKIAISLAGIHAKGLLHRDISPDNIILKEDGNVKLIDFGSTRQFVMNESTDLSVFIKPGFAPMEQYSRTGKQGAWTDVYALGATYYYLLTGHRPPSAADRILGKKMQTLSEMRADIPGAVSHLIDHAMEEDYKKRTQNMEQFVWELDRASKGTDEKKMGVPHLLLKTPVWAKKWCFGFDTTLRLGRSETDCDILLYGGEFSRVHCEIYCESKTQLFYVKDLSSNGTFTNDGRIGKGKYITLQSGGCIFLVNRYHQVLLEVR